MKWSTAFLLLAIAQAPQARDRAARPEVPASDAAVLASGWTSVAAGQYDAGARQADGVLRRRPWDRGAALLKVSALAGSSPVRALDFYEQWIAAPRREDVSLVEPIAIAVLQQFAGDPDAERQRTALTALSASGVRNARAALDALTNSVPENRVARDAIAARSGDTAALARLTELAAAPATPGAYLATMLAGLGTAGEPGLLTLLSTGNPDARAIAAQALGTMKSDRGRAALAKLFNDSDPKVRISVTVALAQMGDQPALDRVDQMLASNVPDVQIAAAEAWNGKPGPWVSVVRGLLDNRDGLTRLEAARVIAPVDPEAARKVLDAALGDANPVIRLESARAIDGLLEIDPGGMDIAALRRRLRDADPNVRLAVACTLLRLARLL